MDNSMLYSTAQKMRTSSFNQVGGSVLKNSTISKVGYSPGKALDRQQRGSNNFMKDRLIKK